MRRTFKIHEAKTHLSRLIEVVEDGGEVIIAPDFDAPLPRPPAAAFGSAARVRPPVRFREGRCTKVRRFI